MYNLSGSIGGRLIIGQDNQLAEGVSRFPIGPLPVLIDFAGATIVAHTTFAFW